MRQETRVGAGQETREKIIEPQTQTEMMNDDRLNNDILGMIPGATIVDVREGRRRS